MAEWQEAERRAYFRVQVAEWALNALLAGLAVAILAGALR